MKHLSGLLARAIAVLCAVFFILTALAALLLFNLEGRAFDPKIYEQALVDENFYQSFPFLLGQVLHRLTLTLLQSALMLALGWLAFGISNQGSYLLLAAVMALGTACFMAMGFALASFAQTAEGYGAISNVFFLPMMFLSGVYFTLDAAPQWLQRSVVALPLSPYLHTLRAIFNDGAGLAGQWGGLAVVAGWTGACFLVAVKRFKWA